jgi:thioredoxin-related protein
MKHPIIRASILLFTGLLLNTSILAAGKVTGGIVSTHPDWFKESFLEISADVEEAAASDKHVMLFMHLNGCPYCYKMVEENIANAPYTDFIKENFDVIAINVKGDREVAFNETVSLTEKALASKLKVIYTPTILFLDADNKVVARTNGYRNVQDFKLVLDYVQEKAYQSQTLSAYINERKQDTYQFIDHPQLVKIDNLQKAADKPLAVLFEDSGCTDCKKLHEGYLSSDEVGEILKNFTFTRLDALSEEAVTDVNGNQTTPKALIESLGITYRPAIVLYDKNREIIRIQSMLYGYQFTETLRYVGERLYEKYPDSFYDYLDVRTKELTAQGRDVDIAK